MSTTLRRRATTVDLPIRLDGRIRAQGQRVHAGLRAAIVEGQLEAGLRLPSSRALAGQLGVRRNAIVAAYEQLIGDGLAEARHGAGTYVAARLPVRAEAPRGVTLNLAINAQRPFALGHTLVEPQLLQRLSASIKRRIATAGPADLGYGDPRGSAMLRREIALHLASSRGIRCDPSCIVIVSGTQAGLRLCCDALFSPGDAVWFEDPGYYASRQTLEKAGLKPHPVPVDQDGLMVPTGAAARRKAKGAYVTPSHQFPTGVTMSMSRRVALLDWARAEGAWIIEDDYDSEFRYAGPPLTALAGIGGERVIYIGTFSKTLFAGLRLAYLVLPPDIVARVVATRAAYDRFPPSFVQDGVADLMAAGVTTAHLRRMRSRYRAARDLVVEVLTRASRGALRLSVPTQGLHMLAYLPQGTSTATARAILAASGVDARLLSETRAAQKGPEAFILGFAGHALEDLEHAAERLGRATLPYGRDV